MSAPSDPFPQLGQPIKSEPLATGSLILGILSLACLSILAGVPAIICGHTARTRINQSNGALAGSEMATIGLVLGYLSVVLFLASIAFAVLAMAGVVSLGLLAQKAPLLQQKAAQPIVTSAAKGIGDACTRYQMDSHSFPPSLNDNDEEVDPRTLFTALAIADDNGVSYYESTGTGIHINGLPCDAWGRSLHVALDLDGDGKVKVGEAEIPATTLVWSSGPDGQNNHGEGDDVKSW